MVIMASANLPMQFSVEDAKRKVHTKYALVISCENQMLWIYIPNTLLQKTVTDSQWQWHWHYSTVTSLDLQC